MEKALAPKDDSDHPGGAETRAPVERSRTPRMLPSLRRFDGRLTARPLLGRRLKPFGKRFVGIAGSTVRIQPESIFTRTRLPPA